jgi:hypothetical protein
MLNDTKKHAPSRSATKTHAKSAPRRERAVRRCPFVASAEVTELAGGATLDARTSEIGLGGCYVDTLNPFPEGTEVQLRILKDDGAFETKAKVVYIQPSFGMGLAFIDLPADQRSTLENWLLELISTQLKSTR